MRFNQQKAWLMDLDIKIGDIMKNQNPNSADKLWSALPKKFQDNSIRWYVNERFKDYKGLPSEEDIYG